MPGSKDWYSPGQCMRRLTFKRIQWLLDYYEVLADGRWPSNPKETGYVDRPVRGSNVKRHAPHEHASMVKATLDMRLDCCDKDGVIVRQVYGHGWDAEVLAELMGWSVEYMDFRMCRAIGYCCGKKKRVKTYQQHYQRQQHRRP